MCINPKVKEIGKILVLTLNSTLTPLCLELFSRQPGGGGGPLDIDVYVAADILLPKSNLLAKYKEKIIDSPLLGRTIENIFMEIGATSPEEVSLDKIKPDRRALDKIVMGEILGLTDEEQLEVYQAVVDLVKSRIEKARSFGDKKKTKEGIDVDALKNVIIEKIKKES